MSMAEAYTILGYKANHFFLVDTTGMKWNKLEQAADATFPTAPGATPRAAFTRADWDELWGSDYDVVMDVASPFNPELIKAYPDAKVVIVQRDFDSWWPSFKTNIRDGYFAQPISTIILNSIALGIRVPFTTRKLLCGFFGVQSREEMDDACGRRVYEEYFRKIRELVPPERRLEYTMGDGWEPLCEFLGAEVPQGRPFPRGNDRAAFQKTLKALNRGYLVLAAKTIGVTVAKVVAGCVSGWIVYHWLLR
ncbi:hypothetical protein F5Y10DRAFT_239895 [Nemania abortiva]|nr:hypothetical protein F5Y10DRAFT_239895 [Nemania abortiva]